MPYFISVNSLEKFLFDAEIWNFMLLREYRRIKENLDLVFFLILLNEICGHSPLIEFHYAIWFCCDEFKYKILKFYLFIFLVIPSTFLAEKYNFTVLIMSNDTFTCLSKERKKMMT